MVTDRSVRVNGTGIVVITIGKCNGPIDPDNSTLVAVEDRYTSQCNATLTPSLGRLLTDNDVSSAPSPALSVTSVTPASVGSIVAFYPNGSFIYTPPADFSGEGGCRTRRPARAAARRRAPLCLSRLAAAAQPTRVLV